MKTKKYTIKALTSVCSILVLAGSLLCFAGEAQAKRRHRAAADPSRTLQPEDSRKADAGGKDVGGKQEAPPNQAAPGYVPPLTAVAPPPSVVSPAAVTRPAAVSLPAVALTGIQVSFKLDPRLTKSLYLGEDWVSPPIRIHAGAPDGTAATVEARADVLDAKGMPVNISPEWIPADSEMVTVSPRQGNEVQITVQRAGQSSLQVTSQRLSKELSIMAWYQGNAIQVEITQKP